MNENGRALINYRIERALEVLKDARTLANAGGWNSCINRLYYSCFYAITALLLRKGLSSPMNELTAIGLKPLDALHVACAISLQCQFFLQ